ncbi:E3 ubiquitin-protein ligase RAD18-like isoform X2 [Frieseomelitta varia]|uniref:E3 ubiquitin-protein ligase RAD18-like isoform X2 n=1 Tax=Frieseomelitta varia TaxID=561572 RepID=UPI001CB691D4|nr:E3 ubiquitin-protein ligase RAD18-like isoform X2 [Frieseomelitta varia]
MWPQEYIELKHIENLLVCGICYEFMDTSVMTSCSHNYCSLCIRKYLHYKTQCPACFAETFEKDLKKNKVLDEIITHFSQIKDKLKRFLQIQMQFAKLHQSKDVDANEQESKVIYKNIISNISISQNITSPSTHVQKDLSSPSTSGVLTIPLMFTPKSSKRPIANKTEETKIVICPVCKVSISELKINRHLDDCLKRESTNEKPQITESKRKPLSKLVFSLMKDVVLKKKAKEFGLSSQGDRKILEARLQRYIVLYNAECDKPNPRPVSELIKQCEDEENTERKANKISFLNKLQVTRNTEENVIENERKKYLETHKNSFESLIKQIKSIDSSKKPHARHSLFTESTESNEDIPHKRQTMTENLNDSMIYTKETDIQLSNSDIYIPDSDSDTSCPLQMYSSSDPKKFLNVELSSANNNVLRNKSENDQTNIAEEASVFSNYSSIKTNEVEKSDSSDARSDTSIYDKATQSVLENSIYEDTLKNNSKNSSDSSKYKKLLQRKKKSSLKDKIKRMDVVTTSMKDLDSDGILNQEEEDERSNSPLQDIVYDLLGNSDSKFDHGKLRSTSYEFLNTSEINFSNLEKENISSPECSSNRSLRKRTRDSTQTDNRLVSNRMKKIKKSSQYSTIENKELNDEESLCILNDEKIECLTNKPQLRKRLSNVTKNTDVLRKSARTKLKNNNS